MQNNLPLQSKLIWKVRHWGSDVEVSFEYDEETDDYEVSFEYDKETYNFWMDMVRSFSKMKYGRIYLTTED